MLKENPSTCDAKDNIVREHAINKNTYVIETVDIAYGNNKPLDTNIVEPPRKQLKIMGKDQSYIDEKKLDWEHAGKKVNDHKS